MKKFNRTEVKDFMEEYVDYFVDYQTNEVNDTGLAEYTADQFNIYEKGFEIPEEIFEMAAEVAEWYEEKLEMEDYE